MQIDAWPRTSGSGDTMMVTCTGSGHQLASDQIGSGPYANNIDRTNVDDGKVVDATKLSADDKRFSGSSRSQERACW